MTDNPLPANKLPLLPLVSAIVAAAALTWIVLEKLYGDLEPYATVTDPGAAVQGSVAPQH